MGSLYRKKGKRYIECSNEVRKEIPFGLWYTHKVQHGERGTSVSYWLGDIKEDVIDVSLLIKIMKLDNIISKLLVDFDNNENRKPTSYNDKAMEILRIIYQKLSEENENINKKSQ